MVLPISSCAFFILSSKSVFAVPISVVILLSKADLVVLILLDNSSFVSVIVLFNSVLASFSAFSAAVLLSPMVLFNSFLAACNAVLAASLLSLTVCLRFFISSLFCLISFSFCDTRPSKASLVLPISSCAFFIFPSKSLFAAPISVAIFPSKADFVVSIFPNNSFFALEISLESACFA